MSYSTEIVAQKAEELTLADLLNLSLGTPEIGAVNFNYLLVVVREILKHLGILHKVTRKPVETDLPLLEQPKHSHASMKWKVEEGRDVKERNDQYHLEGQSEENAKEDKLFSKITIPEYKDLSATATNDSLLYEDIMREPDVLMTAEQGFHTKEDPHTATSSAKESPFKKSPQSLESPKDRKQNSATLRAGSPPVTRPESPTSRCSSSCSTSLSRAEQAASTHDNAFVRGADRRDTKFPAGDMYHVLNINRRLEAAEATIQGITNLLDKVISDVMDLKEGLLDTKNLEDWEKGPPTELLSNEDVEVERLKFEVKKLKEKIKNINFKSDLAKLTSSEQIEDIISKKLKGLSTFLNKLNSEIISRVMDLEHKLGTLDEKLGGVQDSVEGEKSPTVVEQKLSKFDRKGATEKATRKVDTEEIKLALYETEEQFKSMAKSANDYLSLKKDIESMKVVQANEAEEIHRTRKLEETNERMIKILQQSVEEIHANMNNKQLDALSHKPSFTKKDKERMMWMKVQVEELLVTSGEFTKTAQILEYEIKRKGTDIENLQKQLSDLDLTKVDTAFVQKVVANKPERKDLESKVSKAYVDSYIREMETKIQDVLHKCESNQTNSERQFVKLQGEILTKVNRKDLETHKIYLESRLKSARARVQEQQPKGDRAAAFRKPLLQNYNCLSCDKQVDIPQDVPLPSLPYSSALSPSKSLRPYTTFELEQIRQHLQKNYIGSNRERFDVSEEREKLQKEALVLGGVQDLDELAEKTSRACGGAHTLVYSHRRNVRSATFCREDSNYFEPPGRQLLEIEVVGKDGHVYRGRMDQLPPVPDNQDPKEISERHKRTTPVIPSASVTGERTLQCSSMSSAMQLEQMVQ